MVISTSLLVYRCGSEGGWSDLYYFTTMKDGQDWSPRVAVYGDMAVNASSIPRLKQDVANGLYDAILHVGEANLF